MTVVTAAAIGLLGALWISSEYIHFHKQIQTTRRELTEVRKARLKDMVDLAVQFIEYKQSQTELRTRTMIADRVHEAHAIATNLYARYKDTHTLDETKRLVAEALRPIRFDEGRGSIFATSLEGVAFLFAARPEAEGKSILNMVDTEGRRVVSDLIRIARDQDEGYYSYTWTRPGAEGNDFRKLAFIKHFKPFNWYLGTGAYLDDAEAGAKAETIEWLGRITFCDDGYVFAGRWDGVSLTAPAVGRNMIDVTDPNGVKVVAELIEQAKAGGGFVEYVMPKLEGRRPAPKISYAAGVNDWRWYVGAGVYVDDIEASVAAVEAEMIGKMAISMTTIGGVLACVLVTALLIARRTARRTAAAFDEFSLSFEKAAAESSEMSAEHLGFIELDTLAATVNRIIRQRKGAETERDHLEEQLRQAMKMEAIGQLAGGVAHDFNNLLTAIMGNAELLTMTLPDDSEDAAYAEEIVKASTRAAELTRQLLAFSRKGNLQSIRVDVHEAIADVGALLTHSIDRRIRIVQTPGAAHSIIDGDPVQVQSALLNLCLNARDAMAEGGVLTILTTNQTLSEQFCRDNSHQVKPGEYVEIVVSDTGTGMDAETKRRIFEPFYTTKDPGKGAGLGLAAVYGCVHSHRGMITVQSKLGSGSTFRILLPVAAADTPAWEGSVIDDSGSAVTGEILLIDDEEIVRNIAARLLTGLGHTVHTCADGVDGVEYFRRNHDRIDLVVLDLIMPNLSGAETFARLREVDAQIPILISSGFSGDGGAQSLLNEGAAGFLNKPFRTEDLAREVTRILRKGE